VPHARNKTGK